MLQHGSLKEKKNLVLACTDNSQFPLIQGEDTKQK